MRSERLNYRRTIGVLDCSQENEEQKLQAPVFFLRGPISHTLKT